MQPVRLLLLYAGSRASRTLSYQVGWPKHLMRHPRFQVTALDVAAGGVDGFLRRRSALRGEYDAVVILHSVFSNEPHLNGRARAAVARLPVAKAFFLANEYKLMPEKMAFCEEVGVTLLATQSTLPEARRLYEERLPGTKVISVPNAGLDVELFAPRRAEAERPIDIGYRSYPGPGYLGHGEREGIAHAVTQAARSRSLVLDVSLDPADRFDPHTWADFLNRCKGQLGCEAGSLALELTDETRKAFNVFPEGDQFEATKDVQQRHFFAERDRVSGRVISGRISEAAGTKTAQILVRGRYDGYLEPGTHYISVEPSFVDVERALDEFEDPARRREVADAAYEVATTELTYERLIGHFADALEDVL